MKRFLKVTVILTLILTFLAACSSTVTDSSLESTAVVDNQAKTKLTLLINSFFANVGIATTQNGFYRIEENLQSQSGLEIYYYDFETQKKSALSSYTNNQKSNVIDYTMGGIWPMTDQNSLYLYKRGNYWLSGDGNIVDGLATFTKTTLAGEDKQQIRLTSYEEPVPSSGVATDGENIYFISTDLNKDDVKTATINLKAVDFHDKESKVIKQLSIEQTYHIIDVYENNIVIKVRFFDKEHDSPEARQIVKQQIVYFNIDTQEMKTVFEFDPNVLSGVYYENAFYYSNQEGTKIEKLDLADNSISVVINEIPCDNFDITGLTIDNAVHDNKIFISANDKDYKYKYFAVDILTGELYERKLMMPDGGDSACPVMVVGESDDYFVVYNKNYTYQKEVTDPGGVKQTDTIIAQNYTCISKKDFWENNPAYFEFELL